MTSLHLLCMTSLWSMVQAVKIQTYNVALTPYIDNYEDRKPSIMRALKVADYDVMCIQEMWYGSDVATLRKKLDKSVFVYTPPLYQETMIWGLKAPPCHNAPLTALCVLLQCTSLAGNYSALVDCAVGCGLMSEEQGCISCLILSGLTGVLRCFNYIKRESMNAPGVVLLSKRKVNSIKSVYFEPNVKQIFIRAYIEAEIEGVGTVFCSHSSSNIGPLYFEPNLRDVYSSWEKQNLADSRKLTEAASLSSKPLIIGDLNTSPEIPDYNVTADFEGAYNHFLAEGFTSPYVTMVGRCTFCKQSPLTDWPYDNVLDHVMVRNHTVLSAKRLYVENLPNEDFPRSDHYGVEVEIEN